jgi:hypothetical protein
MAVLPGVALDELWQLVGRRARAAGDVGALVAVVSLAGLVAVVLAGLGERRRELAVLRAVGAGPRHVLLLLAAEGSLVTLLGALLGAAAAALAVGGRHPGCRRSASRCRAGRRRWRSGGFGPPSSPRVCLPAWCPAAGLPPVAGRRPVTQGLRPRT